MSNQSFKTLEEADLIFFLVDAKAGLTPVDREIADNNDSTVVLSRMNLSNKKPNTMTITRSQIYLTFNLFI